MSLDFIVDWIPLKHICSLCSIDTTHIQNRHKTHLPLIKIKERNFGERYFVVDTISANDLFDMPNGTTYSSIWGYLMPRTRNHVESNITSSNDPNCSDRAVHSKSSTVNWAAEVGQRKGACLPKRFIEEPSRQVASNPHTFATMKRLFEEQRNDIAKYIMSHLSDVIEPIIINAMNDMFLRLGLSNQRPLSNPVVTGQVPCHAPNPK